MTDTLYCTVDTSRVEEEDKSKAQPGEIRQAIEQELRKSEDRKTWRCVAVTKDPRNTARTRITCRNEAELQLVKEAAEKSAVAGARILRDQLYPVKIDNANRFMNDHALNSLLPRGTKTWQSGNRETTIGLMLASEELASTVIRCAVHVTEHGSDHRAIETTFDITVPERVTEQRLLFKNAPWTAIRARIITDLHLTPAGGGVQQQSDRLMTAVSEAIHALTPKARPSPYAKRWWTTDLTQLRRIYTYWRNRARTQRRAGSISPELEQQAQNASEEYHEAIRKQKKAHWNEFLAEDANIWQASRYLNPNGSAAFDKIPPLKKSDGSTTTDKPEQAAELLAIFFPPLPAVIEDEGSRPQRAPVPMARLTIEEVEQKVLAAKSWKAPGDDGLPAIVWKQIWPAVKERVLSLFQTSLDKGELPTQWRNAKIIPLKKPGKGRLHDRKGVEANLAATHVRQGTSSR
jgi:ribosomal protein S9